jgi:Holliday junction resolvase RusA-like endonuclease
VIEYQKTKGKIKMKDTSKYSNKRIWRRRKQMIYEFEVPGKVIGKGRPRLNSYTGVVYTPTRTKDYESLVEQYFLLKYPRFKVLEGRIKVSIIAYFSIPKTTKKADINEMLENNISPTKKPDIDNIVKSILDSMNKFAFKDDNQITKLEVEKKYSIEDKVYVKIEEY